MRHGVGGCLYQSLLCLALVAACASGARAQQFGTIQQEFPNASSGEVLANDKWTIVGNTEITTGRVLPDTPFALVGDRAFYLAPKTYSYIDSIVGVVTRTFDVPRSYNLRSGAIEYTIDITSPPVAAKEASYADTLLFTQDLILIGSVGADTSRFNTQTRERGTVQIHDLRSGQLLESMGPRDMFGLQTGLPCAYGQGIASDGKYMAVTGCIQTEDRDNGDPRDFTEAWVAVYDISNPASPSRLYSRKLAEVEDWRFGAFYFATHRLQIVGTTLSARILSDELHVDVATGDPVAPVPFGRTTDGLLIADDGRVYDVAIAPDGTTVLSQLGDIDASAIAGLAFSDGRGGNWNSPRVASSPSSVLTAGVSAATGNAAVVSVAADADQDGLAHQWERVGIPYVDQQGLPKRYQLDFDGDGTSDADPLRKDIFVELDGYRAFQLADAVERVKESFNPCGTTDPCASQDVVVQPVTGVPDAKPNVNLHVLIDPEDSDLQRSNLQGNGNYRENVAGLFGFLASSPFDDFRIDKLDYFGTPAERDLPDWPQIREVRQRVVRYGLVINAIDGLPTGYGQARGKPSADFILTSNAINQPVTASGRRIDGQAGVFMHELGHTLGLSHGGRTPLGNLSDDYEINYKPNYISVMNYGVMVPNSVNLQTWRLDYSREALANLNESSLHEDALLSGVSRPACMVYRLPNLNASPLQCSSCSPTSATGNGLPLGVTLIGIDACTDWNGNGVIDTNPIRADINDFSKPTDSHRRAALFGRGETVLRGHHDWPALQYSFRSAPTFLDDALAEAFVCDADIENTGLGSTPLCLADTNGDGMLTPADFNGWVIAFNTQSDACDQNGDGECRSNDFNAWILNFNAGC